MAAVNSASQRFSCGATVTKASAPRRMDGHSYSDIEVHCQINGSEASSSRARKGVNGRSNRCGHENSND
jgi:hypothetical protein